MRLLEVKVYLCRLDMVFEVKIFIVVVLMSLIGCRELPNYTEDVALGNEIVAQVEQSRLYRRDLASVVAKGVGGDDSIALVKVYVDRWARKQIMLCEAERVFSSSEADIEALVEEYRQSLLIRKLEVYYVDNSMNTTFSNSDIMLYYEKYKGDFKLDNTVVKGRVLKFSENYRQAQNLRSLMNSVSAARQQEFIDICKKNGFELSDFSNKWIDFTEYQRYLPILSKQNFNSLLSHKQLQQVEEEGSIYYFQIFEVLKAGEPKPIEFVEDNIKRILFHHRKNEIVKRHEEEIYRKAVTNNDIKLYIK